MTDHDLHVLDDAAALALAAADLVVARARDAIGARGTFRFAVPGGRTPRGMLAALASPPRRDAADWPRATLLLADERAVPEDDPASNARLVREVLLAPMADQAPAFVPMRAGESDLDAAARAYEAELATPLDLLVLGIGEDGHVASLFPGSPLLAERERRVAAVTASPKPPARRLTLTPRAIAEAHAVLVLASGAGKAEAVAAALAHGADPFRVPAALVAAATWLVDRDASPA